ncbi:MAG: queuosine precursor transporter [Candidatus Micrarchaeia archaeon]
MAFNFNLNFNPKKEERLGYLLAFFVTCLMASNFIGMKVALIYGISISVAIITYPFSFVIIDAVTAVYGKKTAQHFVNAGLAMLVIAGIFTIISLAAPAAPRFAYEAEYQTLFAISLRMLVAGLIAYYVAHTLGIHVFKKAFDYFRRKKLWIAANASNIAGEFVDTMIFMYLAFLGVPGFPPDFIFAIAVPWWIFKSIFNALSTPFVYWATQWLKGGE